MPKTEVVRYHAITPRVDGIPLNRVQTLSISGDKARDPVSELGNSGVVEYIEQIPSVSITIDTNNIGNVDPLAILTNKIPNTSITSAIQDVRSSGAVTYKYFNKIKTASVNSSNREITEADFLTAYSDVIVPVTEDGTTITRTAWAHRCALSGLSMSFDVNGNATQNFTLQGNNLQWYAGAWAYANCYKLVNINMATVKSGTLGAWDKQGPNCQTFYFPNSAFPKNSSVIAMAVNEKIFFKSKGWVFAQTTAAAAGTSMFTTTSGYKVKMSTNASWAAGAAEFSTPYARYGDKVYIVYSTSGRSLWANEKIVSTAGSMGALARQHITAYLWNSTESGNEGTSTAKGASLRLQSLNIEVSPGAENLIELGAKNPYGYVRQTPIPINITVSANDSDLDMWAGLAGTAQSSKQIRLEDFNNYNQLRIDIFKNETKLAAEKTATLKVRNMTITGVRQNVSAGGNSTQEVTFLADNFSFKGNGIDPNS